MDTGHSQKLCIKIKYMRAIRIHEFGGPEVLKLEEVERPVPTAEEILVKVYASGVNPADWVVRQGGNDFIKPLLKLPMTIGWDVAGVIEETGSDVTGFKKGDAVYGVANFPGEYGSYAEYTSAKASQFALKPKNISFNEASGVPVAALTAWTGMFEDGQLQQAQRILILGASGGVGSFAVQFAKAKGAYVIGVASTQNLGYMKELGADEVIDYTTQRFEDVLKEIDVVFDAAPHRDNNERLRSVKVLKNGGTLVSTNVDFPFDLSVIGALNIKQAKGALVMVQMRHDWLREIAGLIEAEKVKAVNTKVFPLEKVADAHRESETWHVRGKIVLEIVKEA